MHITEQWGAFLQPLLQWESNKYYIFWVCVCRLRYPAWKAHAPYCQTVACPALHYFPTLSHNWHDFRKKRYWTYNVCFDFPYNFCLKDFPQRDTTNAHRPPCKVSCYAGQVSMTLEFSRQIFEKCSNINCHENPSSGSRIVPRGRTDGQTDVTKLILDFRTFANAPKNIRAYTNRNRRTQKKYCADPQFRRTCYERISHLTDQIFGPGISSRTGPDR